MDTERPTIDEILVRRLVTRQFPEWADQRIRPVTPGGWDNRSFHLGEEMIVRLPSGPAYAQQIDKECHWLPRLAPLLPLAIPTLLAIGEPADGYPWRWAVYGWIEGETAAAERIADMRDLARCLAAFLNALQRIDTTGGPGPGPHNFYRGGSLATYDAETRQAIAKLRGRVDTDAVTEVWEAALATVWTGSPLWIHGDVSPDNLLVRGGELSAVIDFGMLGVGDPACDLAISWTLFSGESRHVFRAMLPLDAGTWARGRGWALWKALIVAADLAGTHASAGMQPWRVINEVLEERESA